MYPHHRCYQYHQQHGQAIPCYFTKAGAGRRSGPGGQVWRRAGPALIRSRDPGQNPCSESAQHLVCSLSDTEDTQVPGARLSHGSPWKPGWNSDSCSRATFNRQDPRGRTKRLTPGGKEALTTLGRDGF